MASATPIARRTHRRPSDRRPYSRAGFARDEKVTAEARGYLASVMPMASASVDRLDQVPDRLRLLFEYEPAAALSRSGIRDEVASPEARRVIEALAEDLAAAPRLLDRQAFRTAAERVRQRTGQKGKALFHPIRVALTAASEASGV